MSETLATPPADPSLSDAGRGAGVRRAGLIMLVIGALLSAVALLSDDAVSLSRYSYGYLMGFVFCWAIVLGALFFVALQHVTNSVWSVVLRRIAEMFAAHMWLIALLFVPLIVLAFYADGVNLFPWSRADLVKEVHGFEKKAPYLDKNFFLVRAAVFFVLWVIFARIFVGGSLRQDKGDNVQPTADRMRKISGPFLVLFGFTLTIASFDWLMSIEPQWYSTIYGVYVFSGVVLSSLAAITIAVIWMRKSGWLPAGLIRHDHLYSLGALLFAFSCFWTYIAFSQYMLIWYGNIPEETVYFIRRGNGLWGKMSMFLVFVRFVAPFFLLLSRQAKMNTTRLVQVSCLVLFGQLVDIYWLIMPQLHPESPVLGWQELAGPILIIGALLFGVGLFVRKHSVLATGDPLLEKSKHFHL